MNLKWYICKKKTVLFIMAQKYTVILVIGMHFASRWIPVYYVTRDSKLLLYYQRASLSIMNDELSLCRSRATVLAISWFAQSCALIGLSLGLAVRGKGKRENWQSDIRNRWLWFDCTVFPIIWSHGFHWASGTRTWNETIDSMASQYV